MHTHCPLNVKVKPNNRESLVIYAPHCAHFHLTRSWNAPDFHTHIMGAGCTLHFVTVFLWRPAEQELSGSAPWERKGASGKVRREGRREGRREWARSQLWRTFSYIQENNTIWPAGLQHEGVMVICHSVVYAYTSRLTACSSKSPPRLYFPDTTALLCNVKSPRSHVGIRSDSQVNVRWFKANTNTDQICKITWQNQWKLMKETKGKPLKKSFWSVCSAY